MGVKIGILCYAPRKKTPSPDGMAALFYQKSWDVVNENLTLMANQFLFDGSMANGLNDTNICLIPKIMKPTKMLQFYPISLCNVSYKLISKVLCHNLKKVLPDRISEIQSAFIAGAFIAGRQIMDYIMLGLEGWQLRRI